MARKSNSLFADIGNEKRLHDAFRALRDSAEHGHARRYIDELYDRMGSPEKTFVDDFQTDGFHTRLFEIGCFAYLEAAGFQVDRSHQRPDFLATKGDTTVALEATTANAPTGRSTDISIANMVNLPQEEVFRKVTQEFPKRMASILSRKLKHQYQELAHCKGRPLVLMIAPFFEAGSSFYTDDAMVPCLYDCDRHYLPPAAPPPFFEMAGAESVSAVFFSNSFTVPRFLRAVTPVGADSGLRAVRSGWCYLDSDTGMDVAEFKYEVDQDAPKEEWWHGITIYHNARAMVPLSRSLLPSSSIFWMRNGRLQREISGFHPVVSFTHIFRT
jgi:hypothetical protein